MSDQVEKRRLKIDADDLMTALHDNSEMIWFLDLETSQVKCFFDGMIDGDNVEEEDFDIDEFLASDRYRAIEGISSSESFDTMRDFIEALPEGRAKRLLTDAISRRKPFRQFKDTLFDLGQVRDEWFEFEEQAQLQAARKWLEDEELEADLVFSRQIEEGASSDIDTVQ